MKKIYFIASLLCVFAINTHAQENSTEAPLKNKKWSYSSGIEGSIIQFARFSTPFQTAGIKAIPRYTYFFNTGIDINYKVSKNLKAYSGLQLKNLGVIYKYSDSIKHKYRVYTIGAPLGVKFYTNNKKLMIKAGVDAALAFNFKWKYYTDNKKVFKDNEFFSDGTNLLFSSVFAGFSVGGISLTGNFYINDFFNEKTIGPVNNARLITLSAGISLDENTLKMKKK
jgi:hypothetical protein